MAETITIYKRQSTLPVLTTERFAQVQQRIRERQQMIQEGKRTQQIEEKYHETLPPEEKPPGLLDRWLGRKQPGGLARIVTKTRTKTQLQELSVEDRFTVMQELMREYVAMLGLLDTHKGQYDSLLTQISDDIRQLVAEKCQQIIGHDERLTRLVQQAEAIEDHGALQMISSQRAQLVQSVQLLGQALLLITKKLDLFRAALQKIDTDQDLKRQVLDKKVKQLGLRYELYRSQKDLYELQKEVADMLRVALNFEEFMRECFGPLQALIEDVTGMDGAFASAVDEIKGLTRLIQNDAAGNVAVEALNDAEDELLNFLLHSQLQREQLADVVKQAWQADADAAFDAELAQTGALSLRQALENLRTFLDVRLPQPAASTSASVSVSTSLSMMLPDMTGETLAIDLSGIVTLEMVTIPGGTFWMGQSDKEQCLLKQWKWWNNYYHCERPRTQVTVQPFYIGKYPVTQAQWEAVMGQNPSKFKGAERPVENVSWDDVQEFLEKLNELTPLVPPASGGMSNANNFPPLAGGHRGAFRLATEAEWEYACRAGSETIWHFGNDPAQLGDYAWYAENSGKKTHPVGQKQPNVFGLYDMLGNIWEWCQDVWHDN